MKPKIYLTVRQLNLIVLALDEAALTSQFKHDIEALQKKLVAHYWDIVETGNE